MADIESQIIVNQKLLDALANADKTVKRAIREKMQSVVKEMERVIKQEKLSGQVLRAGTGRLRSAIGSDVTGMGIETVGRFGVMKAARGAGKTNPLVYAAIHEFGGRIPERKPVKAKALVIPIKAGVYIGGKKQWGARIRTVSKKGKAGTRVAIAGQEFIFRKRARAFTMKERSYIRSTGREKLAWARAQFEAMLSALAEKIGGK